MLDKKKHFHYFLTALATQEEMAKNLEEKVKAAALESKKLASEKMRAEVQKEEYYKKIMEEQKQSFEAVSLVHRQTRLRTKTSSLFVFDLIVGEGFV